MDQTTEEIANKYTQIGTKGFSLNSCAVSRYYMTVEYRKVCLWNLRHMVQVQTSGIVQAELEPPKMQRNLLENSCVNPLSCIHPFELVCRFTASAAPGDVQDDLVHTKTKGEDVHMSFRKNRTNTEESALIFHDRTAKQKYKTFSDIQMYSSMKATHREVLIKDQMLFVYAVYC